MVLEEEKGSWQPKFHNQQPVLANLTDVSGYFEQIGNNTEYIIHPEEILADNFVILINKKKNVQNPTIVAAMKAVLMN